MAPSLITTVIALLGLLPDRQSDPAHQDATQPAATQPAATQPDADRSQPSTQPADAFVDVALAGKYYTGDGLGYNLSLTLGDDGTFSCTWRGCLGVYGTASGTWSRTADRVSFVTLEATGMLRRYLRGATVVAGGDFPALVLDQHHRFYRKYGRDRYSALQRTDDTGWIENAPPPTAATAPTTRPRGSWLSRLFSGE